VAGGIGDSDPLLAATDVEHQLAAEQHLAVDLPDHEVVADLAAGRRHGGLVDVPHALGHPTAEDQSQPAVTLRAEPQIVVAVPAGHVLGCAGASASSSQPVSGQSPAAAARLRARASQPSAAARFP
jgi:hypothetical protein